MADRKAEIALFVGGILAIVGTFLTFATVKGAGVELSLTGSEAEEASNYILAGVIALVAGVVMWVAKGATPRKVMAILTIVLVGFLGVFGAIADITSVDDGTIAEAGFEASVGIGLYVCLVGSVIAVVGAVMALRRSGSAAPTMDASAPAAP